MRRVAACFALLLLLPAAAHAQLRLGLRTANRAYLQYEPVRVELQCRNDTEVEVEFGRYTPAARILISRERSALDVQEAIVDRPPVTGTVLQPGDQENFVIEVGDYVDLSEPGRYIVRVAVDWMGRTMSAGTAVIDIVNGMALRTVEKSVPYEPARIREYTLLYWGRDGVENLFLRVSEPAAQRVLGVFDLGRLVRTHPPEIEFDRIGRVHVTHLMTHDVVRHTYLLSDREGIWVWKRRTTNREGEDLMPPEEVGGGAVGIAEGSPAAVAPAAAGEKPRSRYLLKRLWPFRKAEPTPAPAPGSP